MYIHIGNDRSLLDRDIIGIFDIETSVADDTREYLAAAGRRKNAVYVSFDMTKSYIVAVDGSGMEKVYITNVSHRTISCRAGKSGKAKR